MKLTPQELSSNDYLLLEELNHKEVIPFVQKNLKQKTFFSRLYTVINIFFFFLILAAFFIYYNNQNFSIGKSITHLCYGFAIAFLLTPLHEYIHVLAYKYVGAKNTSYDANLKKFYFMALADKFVANKKEFQIVALAPFLFVSLVCLNLLFLLPLFWKFTALGILLCHTAFCSGDFGLLSYFDVEKNKEVLTYDDVEKGISYFYGKEKE